jgi:Pyridoxamine 5'-phosphate oxidase
VAARDASWDEVAERLAGERSYWLGTVDPGGAPHAVPVWGVVVAEDLFLYTERRTAKARHVALNPQVIVRGDLVDLGLPQDHAEVLRALRAKYSSPADSAYLPSADPDFDLLWRLEPRSAMVWRLDDYDDSQARWRAP